MAALASLDLPSTINTTPNEVETAIPFDEDDKHRSYDPEYANRFWRVLLQSDRVFKEFRVAFLRQMQSGAFFLGQF